MRRKQAGSLQYNLIVLCVVVSFLGSKAYAQESVDLHRAIELALQNSARAMVLLKTKEAVDAEIRVEAQRNNPSLLLEDTRSEPNYFVGGGYTFELAGKRSKRVEVATNEAAAAAADYRSGILSLRHDVRLAFYGVLASSEKQKQLAESRDLAARLRDVAQQRFEAGEVARLEVLSAEVEWKQRENDAKQAEADQQAAVVQLNGLLNRDLQAPLQLSANLDQEPNVIDQQSLMNRALAQSYDLLSVASKIKAEEARLGLAHAERTPDLDIEAGTEIHDVEHEYGWRASLRLELPILNRRNAEILRSTIVIAGLKAQQQATQQKLRADISAAYIKYQAALFQIENYKKEILPEAQELSGLAEESYKEGKTNILAVIEAQRNFRQIRLQYFDAVMQLQTALADLEVASGVELE